jgi:hypothetical protein
MSHASDRQEEPLVFGSDIGIDVVAILKMLCASVKGASSCKQLCIKMMKVREKRLGQKMEPVTAKANNLPFVWKERGHCDVCCH